MIYRIYTALKIAENIYSTIMMIWRVKSGKFRIRNEQGTVPCFTNPIVSSIVSDLFDIVSRSVVLRMNGMILG